MIKNFKINLVVEGGMSCKSRDKTTVDGDPYIIPKKLGIYQVIESNVSLTAN